MSTNSAQEFLRIGSLVARGELSTLALEAIARAVEAELPATACAVHLLDASGACLWIAAGPSLPAPFKTTLDGIEIDHCAGPLATALPPRFGPLAAAAGFATCQVQPIRSIVGQEMGVLAVYFVDISVAGHDLTRLMQQAADSVADVVGHPHNPGGFASRPEQDAARDLTTFFDVSLDMLCIRDRNGNFVRANRAWETTLGYRIDELEGSPMLPLIHPDDVASTRDLMQRIHVEGEILGFINRYRHRDGHYRHLEWRARHVGDIVFGVARDVTDRLAIEAEMQTALQGAEAANRAKSDFLANMSHEIRTPLNGVIGVVAALTQTELTPAQREMVGLIQSSGVTLERLVSDILDLSKVEAGRLEIETRVFDLQAEMDALVEVNRSRAHEKGLSFHLDYGERARGEFWGDDTRIKQVLGNLLSNAVKFTSQGAIAVRVDVDDPETPGTNAVVTLEIEDTGVGFDAASSAVIFQRFSQADTTITRRFGGTGLGLPICKAFVEMMGGEITARSEPGRGSLFRVTLPLARHLPLDAYDARQSHPPSAAGVGGGEAAFHADCALRILLAEDHPTNQKVVQLILAPYGAEVITVENGAEAVEAFAAGRFDLVLMDMQMPVMDGLAATRAIRIHEQDNPHRPRTPIVMLSANAMRQHRQDALDAGADLHIAKPVTAVSLVAGIEAALSAYAL
ncbi:MAG TPA: ATP-binding protein [Caulobacteraceae bacterium]|jgi:PAS domain S-box-containing protein